MTVSRRERDSSKDRALPPRWPWEPFVWAAILLASTSGFAAGAALFGAVAVGLPIGLWWPAHAQIHGHVQVFGWAALMVLGVGFHFLPRLRGTTLARPGAVKLVFWLLVSGLVVRALAQPPLAVAREGAADLAARALVVASGLLEWLAVIVAMALLAATVRTGPPLAQRPGFASTVLFFVVGFIGLFAALTLNLIALVRTLSGDLIVPPNWHQAALDTGLYLFVLPIALAMSVRTFPLYIRIQFPNLAVLRVALGLIASGAIGHAIGSLTGFRAVDGIGLIAVGVGVLTAGAGMQVFRSRRKLPRQEVRILSSPAQLHALSAYGWLAVAGAIMLVYGAGLLGITGATVNGDAARHAVGVGFITLLIFGVGADMLPAFASRQLASVGLFWATLVLGNLAALLRVGPALLPSPPAWAMAIAGVAGTAGIICFGLNIWRSIRGSGRGWAT